MGGKIVFPGATGEVVQGALVKPINSIPGEFNLVFYTSNDPKDLFTAHLAIDFLADGTVDVRGMTLGDKWPLGLVVEGVGNTKFVVPNQ